MEYRPYEYRPDYKPKRFAVEEMGAGMSTTPLRRVIVVLIFAVIFLAVFNSEGLVSWSMKMPVGTIGDSIVAGAVWWNDQMDAVGATHLRQSLKEAFQSFQMF